MTDIDALHKVIEKREVGDSLSRGCGKTFARCHELAGVIEVGDFKVIVVAISLYRDLQYILPMIKEVFAEHGLEWEYRPQHYEILCNDKHIYFIPHDALRHRTRGLGDYFYHPMGRDD